jgi:magnesium chelatase family protein
MRTRIQTARDIQAKRYQNTPLLTNAQLSGKWLQEFCPLGDAEHGFLESAVKNLGLSARAFTRILRIARTIADLSGDPGLSTHHLAEAINYRTLDRQNDYF